MAFENDVEFIQKRSYEHGEDALFVLTDKEKIYCIKKDEMDDFVV